MQRSIITNKHVKKSKIYIEIDIKKVLEWKCLLQQKYYNTYMLAKLQTT